MLGTILEGARIKADALIESLGEEDADGSTGEETAPGGTTPENFISRISGFLKGFTLKKYDAGEQGRIRETIRRTSGDARLVLLGLRVPEPRGERAYARELLELTKTFPPTLLVKGHPALNVFR
jgi:hypothetical protein